ncbi:MAG TPA: hypothetical protein VHA77_15850 [Xanthobacteraceae bacterium]|jgi:hypothetical protein|nr:hypothetical protein [Xanthobacteraceae bacterium]
MNDGQVVKVISWPEPNAPPREATYVVAEPDSARAVDLLRRAVIGPHQRIEVIGGASKQLLHALALAPGQFTRT